MAKCDGAPSSRFSVVIPAVLQRLNSGNVPSAEKWAAKPLEDREYAVAVISTILRCHVAPLPLCALLMQQAEYDWLRDGSRIECKSSQLQWNRDTKRWAVVFQAIKLPYHNVRLEAATREERARKMVATFSQC